MNEPFALVDAVILQKGAGFFGGRQDSEGIQVGPTEKYRIGGRFGRLNLEGLEFGKNCAVQGIANFGCATTKRSR